MQGLSIHPSRPAAMADPDPSTAEDNAPGGSPKLKLVGMVKEKAKKLKNRIKRVASPSSNRSRGYGSKEEAGTADSSESGSEDEINQQVPYEQLRSIGALGPANDPDPWSDADVIKNPGPPDALQAVPTHYRNYANASPPQENQAGFEKDDSHKSVGEESSSKPLEIPPAEAVRSAESSPISSGITTPADAAGEPSPAPVPDLEEQEKEKGTAVTSPPEIDQGEAKISPREDYSGVESYVLNGQSPNHEKYGVTDANVSRDQLPESQDFGSGRGSQSDEMIEASRKLEGLDSEDELHESPEISGSGKFPHSNAETQLPNNLEDSQNELHESSEIGSGRDFRSTGKIEAPSELEGLHSQDGLYESSENEKTEAPGKLEGLDELHESSKTISGRDSQYDEEINQGVDSQDELHEPSEIGSRRDSRFNEKINQGVDSLDELHEPSEIGSRRDFQSNENFNQGVDPLDELHEPSEIDSCRDFQSDKKINQGLHSQDELNESSETVSGRGYQSHEKINQGLDSQDELHEPSEIGSCRDAQSDEKLNQGLDSQDELHEPSEIGSCRDAQSDEKLNQCLDSQDELHEPSEIGSSRDAQSDEKLNQGLDSQDELQEPPEIGSCRDARSNTEIERPNRLEGFYHESRETGSGGPRSEDDSGKDSQINAEAEDGFHDDSLEKEDLPGEELNSEANKHDAEASPKLSEEDIPSAMVDDDYGWMPKDPEPEAKQGSTLQQARCEDGEESDDIGEDDRRVDDPPATPHSSAGIDQTENGDHPGNEGNHNKDGGEDLVWRAGNENQEEEEEEVGRNSEQQQPAPSLSEKIAGSWVGLKGIVASKIGYGGGGGGANDTHATHAQK